MPRHPLLLAAVLLLAASAASAAEGGGRPRVHGGGRPVTLDELPPGAFHDRIAGLPPAAQARALAWMSRFQFHDADCQDLRASDDGSLYYACSNAVAAPAGPRPALPTTGAAPVPIASPPSYHSRSGSSRHIYLDFNGATITGTAWNGSGASATFTTVPYDLDGDQTTFSDTEQTAMHRIWERVAEDYAPFDVDVTTDPAFDGSTSNNVAHVLITTDTDKNGTAMPSQGAGGVAWIGVFGQGNYASTYSPAFIYYNRLGGGQEDYVAEACSHETGHNVGLSHDSTNTGEAQHPVIDYYSGHGSGATSWAPIMGVGYGKNVTQFSKGEYYDANNTQDDLSIIAGYLTVRADDYGNTDSAATALTGTTLSASGIISSASDVDVVSFASGAGAISIAVNPWQSAADTKGGNLDVKLVLADSSHTVIATSDDPTVVSGSISTVVTAGTYYLRISGTGCGTPTVNPPSGYTSYGSIGQWFLSGSVPSAQASIAVTDWIASESGDTGQFTVTLAPALTVATTVNYTVSGTATNGTDYTALSGSVVVPAHASSAIITVTPLADALTEGPETVTLTLAAGTGYAVGAPSSDTLTITDGPPPGVASTPGAGADGGSPKCGFGGIAGLLIAGQLLLIVRRRSRR